MCCSDMLQQFDSHAPCLSSASSSKPRPSLPAHVAFEALTTMHYAVPNL